MQNMQIELVHPSPTYAQRGARKDGREESRGNTPAMAIVVRVAQLTDTWSMGSRILRERLREA